jgi:hypothetical protein
MSTVYDAFNNDERWFGRFFTAAAHWMLYGVALVAACRIPYYLGVDSRPVRLASDVAFVVVVIGMLHNNFTRLCVRCMQEVPADAGPRAQRRWPILRLFHEGGRAYGLVGIIVLVAGLAGTRVLMERFGFPRAIRLPIDILWIAYLYSMWLHHRLRPWCPYCPDWGDDGGIREPSPDPVTKATI